MAFGVGTVLAVLLAIIWVGPLPLAFYIVGTWDARYGPNPCEEAIVARVLSPDGMWEARLDETACLYGMGVGYVVAQAQLVSTHDPTRTAVLLGADTGGHENERPRLAWTAPDVLQVTVYDRSYLKVLTRGFGGVRVELRYDPDDPADRAAWRRAHGMSPEP